VGQGCDQISIASQAPQHPHSGRRRIEVTRGLVEQAGEQLEGALGIVEASLQQPSQRHGPRIAEVARGQLVEGGEADFHQLPVAIRRDQAPRKGIVGGSVVRLHLQRLAIGLLGLLDLLEDVALVDQQRRAPRL